MKIIILLIILNFNFIAFGQRLKEIPKNKTEIEILLAKGIKPELAFFWETKDTLILPYINFRETIQFDLIKKRCMLQNNFNQNKIQLKKGLELKDRNVIDSQRDYEYNFDIKNDIMIIEYIYTFKIYFDKKRKNILKIENLDNKHIFIPKKYEYFGGSDAPFEVPSRN